MKKILGIDLGSSNTIVYIPKKGIIFNEPSVIAVNKATKKVESIGYLAFKMLGKTQDSIEVIRPIKNGVIADGPKCVLFLRQIFKELKLKRYIRKAQLIFSCPSEITQIELASLHNVARKLDFKNVIVKTSSYLASLGNNNDGATYKGSLCINIGGGITDISVLSNDEVILSKSCSFSGRQLDEAIVRHVRKNHRLIIGFKTAEYIKMKIGSVELFPENRLLEVSGIDIVSNLPHSVVISTSEIKSCIMPYMGPLIDTIKDCLEITPPEIASELIESGIVVTGGGALLAGMREYLESNLNISIRIASDPTSSVVLGMKIIAHDIMNKNN